LSSETAFDLIVIGTGTAGSTAAAECRTKGWRVAIIDSLPFGGTCALRGCKPKKILLEAAKIVDSNKSHENKGISDSKAIHIKWPNLIRFKGTFTDSFLKQREDSYYNLGIVPFHGHARFICPSTIRVENDGEGVDGKGNIIMEGKHVLIATGSKPAYLNSRGI
jgi:glutathione reductase (NADPH)